ncbi:MAG: ThiF family adenylyltransferase [Kiritimatiellae bacterium]|nr:ThiF family adenylyltransferase [Kiritimatiellia bacterium]
MPVVYALREDLDLLSADPARAPATGLFCEWEGEDVVHLRLRPPLHAYGRTGPCLFLHCPPPSPPPPTAVPDGIEWVAAWHVSPDGPALRAFRRVPGGPFSETSVQFVPARSELHSRARGILEADALAARRVAIVGLGSFGSQIAVELAKAGVGSFALFDFDRVELHNLMRHVCGVNDLGRLKTDAIRDAILAKNPYAAVDRFPVDINADRRLLSAETARADLVICATDNNRSRFSVQSALLAHGKTGLFGRAVTRAEGGDVFRHRPGGPCYCCLVGTGWYNANDEELADLASARRSGRIPAYVSPADAEAAVQVGLSADIAPICNFLVKLALVELARGTSSALDSLDAELVHDYWLWANRRERHYANWGPFPSAGSKPAILRWYGAFIQRRPDCPYCAPEPEPDAAP